MAVWICFFTSIAALHGILLPSVSGSHELDDAQMTQTHDHSDTSTPSVTVTSEVATSVWYSSPTIDEFVDVREGECEVKMSACIVKGHEFLNHYVKRIRKDSQVTKCSRYLIFRTCIVALLNDECRGFETRYEIWKPIIEQMDCVCNKSEECLEGQTCFFKEIYGYWASRCNDFYRFNLRQRTRHQCHFVEENIRCKESLVSSSCDQRVSRFASSFLEISMHRETQCQRIEEFNHTDSFSYSSNCRPSFLDRIDRCTTRSLTARNVVKFHRENDVIVIGNRNALKNACRSLQKYKTCLKPLEKSCPDGVTKVLEYGQDLKKYLLKMNFICENDVHNVYRQNLQCYQKVMKREFLKQCDVIWKDLTPWLENTTSYEFYCEPHHSNTRNLARQLTRLISCHEAVFNSQCGRNASAIMTELLRSVFSDPVYLRFSYKPDCRLHAPTTTTTTSTTSMTTTTTTTAATTSTLSTTTDSSIPTTTVELFSWIPTAEKTGSNPKADHRRTELNGATRSRDVINVYLALALPTLLLVILTNGISIR